MTKNRIKKWSAPEVEALRQLYPTVSAPVLCERFNCNLPQLYYKADKLGLKKTHEALSNIARQSASRPDHPGKNTRFKPDQTPWNKGLKGWQAGGRSVETQFKPKSRTGAAAHNYKPIGHERVADGYLQRKLTDTGVTRRDYVCVHHIIWREAGKEIPPGYALCFKDGNRQNITLENLELVSRAELLRRNSVHAYGPEIAQLHQLQGAIQRQINKRLKQQQGEA